MGNKKQRSLLNSGIVKRAVHAINEYGNKPIYQDGFDAWYSSLTGNNLALLRSEAAMAYEKENGPLYPEGASFWEMLKPEYSQKALRWWYDTKVHPSRRNSAEKRANMTRSQNAVAISLAGSAISAVPHVYTKIAGTALTIPDQIYDWASAIDEPKNSNTAHVVLDYPELLGKVIPGKVDDVVLKVGNLVSNVDDLTSTREKNLFSFLDGPEYRPTVRYSESKPQIESTRVKTSVPYIIEKTNSYKQGGILKRVESGKSGIHIKPENRGKLTRLKKRTGKSEEELWKEGNPAVRKMITFARNARKWKHK